MCKFRKRSWASPRFDYSTHAQTDRTEAKFLKQTQSGARVFAGSSRAVAQLGTNPGDAGIFLLPLNGHPIGLVQSQPSNLM